MAPHGIYPSEGDDRWVSIACRDDAEWARLATHVGEPWTSDERFATLDGRLGAQDDLDRQLSGWTSARHNFDVAASLQALGIPAMAVQLPEERVDHDPNTAAWGLWPTVQHTYMGDVRVDGIGAHMSRTDWEIARGAPCLGEHNDYVLGELLGYSGDEINAFRAQGVI
jgi:crotonobetainyl-CoA:carnitine CoA-transferase CaiB-like acyl-CoA transferase